MSQRFRFNTMIAAMMKFTNALAAARDAGPVDAGGWKATVDALLLCLAPSAPHIAEELWRKRGGEASIHLQAWPQWDEAMAAAETVTLVVQVNGKVRDKLALPAGTAQAEAEAAARASGRVAGFLDGMTERRVVWVPDRLLNFVVSK